MQIDQYTSMCLDEDVTDDESDAPSVPALKRITAEAAPWSDAEWKYFTSLPFAAAWEVAQAKLAAKRDAPWPTISSSSSSASSFGSGSSGVPGADRPAIGATEPLAPKGGTAPQSLGAAPANAQAEAPPSITSGSVILKGCTTRFC